MKMFGRVLRGRREFLKLSFKEVADQVKLSPGTINALEGGQMPSLSTLLILSKWMGIKASTFLDEDESEPAPAEVAHAPSISTGEARVGPTDTFDEAEAPEMLQ